jgi:hypothetical protein
MKARESDSISLEANEVTLALPKLWRLSLCISTPTDAKKSGARSWGNVPNRPLMASFSLVWAKSEEFAYDKHRDTKQIPQEARIAITALS